MRKPPNRSSSARATLISVPISVQVFDDYDKLRARHGWAPAVLRHHEGVWIYEGGKDPRMVLGVQLFASELYLLAEDMMTNPDISPRVRRAAVLQAAHAVMQYAAMRRLIPRMTVTSMGLCRLLEKAGFRRHMAIPMACSFPVVRRPVEARKVGRAAPARDVPANPSAAPAAASAPKRKVSARARKSRAK